MRAGAPGPGAYSAAMLLAIDVGNSNIVVGVFDGERLVADFRLRTDAHATGDELGLTITGLLRSREVDPANVDGVVVSSVVPTLSRSIEGLSQSFFGLTPMVVGPGVRTGMRILYDDPRQVGADRLVTAHPAYRRDGGPPSPRRASTWGARSPRACSSASRRSSPTPPSSAASTSSPPAR
jgi:hypothetical protein